MKVRLKFSKALDSIKEWINEKWKFIEKHLGVTIICLFFLSVLFVVFCPKAVSKTENYEDITLVISIFALVISLTTTYLNFNTYLDSKGFNEDNSKILQRPFFIFEDFEKNCNKNYFILKFKFVTEKNMLPIYNVKVRAVIDCIGEKSSTNSDGYANKLILTSTKFINFILPNKDKIFVINYDDIIESDNNISKINLSKVLVECDVNKIGKVFVECNYINNDEKKIEILQYQEEAKQIYLGKNNSENKEMIESDIKKIKDKDNDNKVIIYSYTNNMDHEL